MCTGLVSINTPNTLRAQPRRSPSQGVSSRRRNPGRSRRAGSLLGVRHAQARRLAAAVLRRRMDPARRARQRPSDSPSSVSVGCSLPAPTPIACQYAEGRSSRQDLVGPPNSLGSRQIAACFGSGAFPPLIGQKTRSGPSRSPGEPRARPRCRRPVRVEARPDRRPWCGPCVDLRCVDRSKAAHAAGGGLWTGNRSAGTGSRPRVS
jgi:hypothetical protein